MADETTLESPKNALDSIRKRRDEDKKRIEKLVPQIATMSPEEIARTIVARERYEERTKKWAGIDALTGLLRRGPFANEVRKEIEAVKRDPQKQRSLIVSLGDLDDFGMYNKIRGEHVGDQVLKGLGAKLKDVTRPTDDVCRWGGEEFAISMPYSKIHEKEAESIHPVERLRNNVSEVSIDENGNTSKESVSLTFGTTDYEPNDSFDTMFLKASKALKIAKLLGKGRTVVAQHNAFTDLSNGKIYLLEIDNEKREILYNVQEKLRYTIMKSPVPQARPVLVKLD